MQPRARANSLENPRARWHGTAPRAGTAVAQRAVAVTHGFDRHDLRAVLAADVGADEIAEVVAVLESGWLTTGPRVRRFEAEFAAYAGAPHAVAVNSCTAALHLSLLASGVGRGARGHHHAADVLRHGQRDRAHRRTPVFADVDPVDLEPRPGRRRGARSPRARARCCRCTSPAGRPTSRRSSGWPRAHGLALIEDAAHCVEGVVDGRKVGSIADFTCFSFYATKNLTTGEGGMVTTRDETRRRVRAHGLAARHEPRRVDALRARRQPALRRGDARLQIQHDGPAGRDRPAAARAHRTAMHARREAICAALRRRPSPTCRSAGRRPPRPARCTRGTSTRCSSTRALRRVARRAAAAAARARRGHQHPLPRRAPALLLPRAVRLRAAACSRTPRRSRTTTLSLPLSPAMPDGDVDRVIEALHDSLMPASADLRVLFRAPAGPRRGFGHLVRCRSLARALGVAPLIARARRRPRPRGGAARSAVDVVAGFGARGHRGASRPTSSSWTTRSPRTPGAGSPCARRAGCRVVTVHDLGLGACDGDLVVDGSVVPRARAARRAAVARLRGPRFAILDPAFAAARRAQRRDLTPRVLIALGGGPRAALAYAIATRRAAPDAVGRGSGSPAASPHGLRIGRSRPRSPGPARSTGWPGAGACDVAVVGGGVSLYEACARGVAAVAVPVVVPQRPTVRGFVAQQAAPRRVGRASDADGVAREWCTCCAGRSSAACSRPRGRRLVDGRGAIRVADAIRQLARQSRRAAGAESLVTRGRDLRSRRHAVRARAVRAERLRRRGRRLERRVGLPRAVAPGVAAARAACAATPEGTAGALRRPRTAGRPRARARRGHSRATSPRSSWARSPPRCWRSCAPTAGAWGS